MLLDEWKNIVASRGNTRPPGKLHQQQQWLAESIGDAIKTVSGTQFGVDSLLVGEATVSCHLTGPDQTVAQYDPLKELPANTAQYYTF